MKRNTQLLGLFLIALGCADKHELPAPTTEISVVEFVESTIDINEQSEFVTVEIHLNKPISENGNIDLSTSGSARYGVDYTTSPASIDKVLSLNLSKDDSSVTFKVYPMEDGLVDGEKNINFTIGNVSASLQIGSKKSLKINIEDKDEAPVEEQFATIEFVTYMGQMMENETSYQILLNLTGEIDHTELVFIAVESSEYVYGTDYTTEPMAIDGTIRIDVLPGQSEVSFNLFSINNNVLNGNRSVFFSLEDVSDGLLVGENTSFELEVVDDEEASTNVHTIFELREYFHSHQGDWYLSSDYYVEGVITSGGNVINNHQAYLQDETGGILLIFNGPNLHAVGTKVRLNLRNGLGLMVNDQKTIVDVEDRAGVILQRGVTVAPVEITQEQYYSGAYQGMRVTVTNLTLEASSVGMKWLGTRRFHGPDGRYISVLTNPTADFSDYYIPSRALNITGIVGDWGWLQPQTVADFAFY